MIRRCVWLSYCGWILISYSGAHALTHDHSAGDTLAAVDGRVITAQDLIERTGLMPWPGKDNIGERDSAMIRALRSLVAEQILAIEATARGMANDTTFRDHVHNVEKLVVRDELYRREVTAKVTTTRQEIREGLKRYAWQVRILMIGATSLDNARAIATALRSGGRRDSILTHLPNGSSVTVDTVTVNFGMLERKQEDTVYALDSTSPTSAPLEVPRLGWVVLSLLGKETNPEYAKRSVPERSQAVAEKVRKRHELERARRFQAELLAPMRASARPSTFDVFAGTLYRMICADSAAYRKGAGYRLDALVDDAEHRLETHLEDILVDMDGTGLTIRDVLESYRTFNFFLPDLNETDFRERLNGSIREVVAREFIAREGYRQHLEHAGAVKHDVGTWSEYWLAQKLRDKIVGDVTVRESEVIEYLISYGRAVGQEFMVNVREVLCVSLHEALSVAEQIVAGGNMMELARTLSKRKEWAARGGESGFFIVAKHPEIGFRALDADIGALVGPVNAAEGYSVFTVLGKRHLLPDSALTFDSLKTVTRNILLAEKRQKLLNTFVASWASQHHVRLYYDTLKKVKIMPANMVTRRFIGFGGSMLAVPSLPPLWQWVEEGKNVEEVFP